MDWGDILGQSSAKKYLQDSIAENRVSHAQLFIGKDGYGTLALAWLYASKVLSEGNADIAKRIIHLQHPDLHFTYPTIRQSKDKSKDGKEKKSLSKEFYKNWINILTKNTYLTYDDWLEEINVENQQALISADEIHDKLVDLSIKSFEGGYKILIVWHADKMNSSAANKFLKMLEEPPDKTLFILIAEDEESILPTIYSRCQTLRLERLDDSIIKENLIHTFQVEEERATSIAFEADGNWSSALKIVQKGNIHEEFETMFIEWTRNAFKAKSNFRVLKQIVHWSQNISSWGREKQKDFIGYCAETFRQALIQNYQTQELVFQKIKMNQFNWEAFSKYIHGANILDILDDISEADYHIERNANPKIIFLDLGIKLTRYIHRSPR